MMALLFFFRLRGCGPPNGDGSADATDCHRLGNVFHSSVTSKARARDPKLGAIKVLPEAFAGDAEGRYLPVGGTTAFWKNSVAAVWV